MECIGTTDGLTIGLTPMRPKPAMAILSLRAAIIFRSAILVWCYGPRSMSCLCSNCILQSVSHSIKIGVVLSIGHSLCCIHVFYKHVHPNKLSSTHDLRLTPMIPQIAKSNTLFE